MMSVLVLLVGSIRGSTDAWDSLFRNVLDVNSAHLALSIGAVALDATHRRLVRRANWTWTLPEYDDWGEYFDARMNGTRWRRQIPARFERGQIIYGPVRFGARKNSTAPGSAMVNFALMLHAHDQMRRLGLFERYGVLVVTRADHFYACAEPRYAALPGAPDDVWIPDGMDWGGFNDRFRACRGRASMVLCVTWFAELFRGVTTWRSNSERYLKERLKRRGAVVRRYRRTMFVTHNATADAARWQTHLARAWATAPAEPVFGQHPKYDEEYTCAMKTCGFGPNVSAALYRRYYDRCSASLLQLGAPA